MSCPVCQNAEARSANHRSRDAINTDCPQCGRLTISRSAAEDSSNEENSNSWKLSAWISEFAPAMVTSADIASARSSRIPSLNHRADRMLRWINEKFPPGMLFSLDVLGNGIWDTNSQARSKMTASRLMPIGWNRTIDEMFYMVTEVLCNEMGLLVSQNNHDYQVSPKGLLYLEGHRDAVSSIGFCAMWFSEDVKPLWTQVIEPAIRAAGYEPLRIDSKQHNGKIDDEIMASIRASRFVVSDFTGNRGGVYYEAGFAHGLGLPVVFMCREGDDLHFDVRQYNCIFWKLDALDEARERLKNRLLATLGQGPLNVK